MAATAATSASLFNSSKQIVSTSSTSSDQDLGEWDSWKCIDYKLEGKLLLHVAAALVADASVPEFKDYVLPRWADFDLGRAPVYWKTMNGLPPTAGERLKLFYNPTANTLAPNEDYGLAFNGGFNNPIMCGSERRVMLQIK